MSLEQIGRYRIVRLLGRGGMGTVYEAIDETIEHQVAIKILHPEFASAPDIVDRFLNEARAANRIGHASVVKVSDWGRLDNGQAYLVMEYLDGMTLGQRLKQSGGRLPLGAALTVGSELAEALDAGHRKGIVHRDLKPDNVKLVTDSAVAAGERCKLFDFGIAKVAVAEGNSGATQTAMVIGTVGYMPPEQIRDASRVSERSDVYALGVLIFQMIAGRRPFAANNDADLMAMVLRDQPPRLDELVPHLHPELTALVAQMLASDLADRPTMREVVAQLKRRRDELLPTTAPGHWEEPLRQLTGEELLSVTRAPSSRPSGAGAPSSGAVSGASRPGAVAGASRRDPAFLEPTSNSGLVGENAAALPPQRPRWYRLLAVLFGITIGGLGLGGYVMLAHRAPKMPQVEAAASENSSLPGKAPLAADPRAAGSGGVSLGAAVAPQPPIDPFAPPPAAVSPPVAQEPVKPLGGLGGRKPPEALPRDVTHKPEKRKSDFATAQCVQGPMALSIKQEIAQVMRKADVRIPAGESVQLLLQGSSLVIANRPDFITSSRENTLLTLFAFYQTGKNLPAGVHITVQCKGVKP